MSLYTNSTGKDTIRNAFYVNLKKDIYELLIASPFFSYDSFLEEITKLNKYCLIRLIVRLGPATSPDSLKKLINNDQIHIRYFTSPQFHSKLYIFGDRAALVGSANLTQAGFQSNKEICIEISQEDDSFDELLKLYNSYWNQAEVLTLERLNDYKQLYQENIKLFGEYELEKGVLNKFGDVAPSEGVHVDKKKKSKEKIFLESYRRTYQEFLTAYRVVEKIYIDDSRRQQPEKIVPLRIEIDQFFSFIRELYAVGDTWKNSPFLYGQEQKEFIMEKLDEWFSQRWDYLDEKIPHHFRRINSIFSSVSKIQNANMEQIFNAIDVCHSFHDRFRFFPGGHKTLKETFIDQNKLEDIKYVFSYLLYGEDDFITRMGNCILDENYSIKYIGRSIVQELLGWVNKENIPICNGRTVKALRYLGFKVVVFT